jgi:hypothetical protein
MLYYDRKMVQINPQVLLSETRMTEPVKIVVLHPRILLDDTKPKVCSLRRLHNSHSLQLNGLPT